MLLFSGVCYSLPDFEQTVTNSSSQTLCAGAHTHRDLIACDMDTPLYRPASMQRAHTHRDLIACDMDTPLYWPASMQRAHTYRSTERQSDYYNNIISVLSELVLTVSFPQRAQ